MRIALLTSGRFTLVDIARELSALGHDVKVYSLLPSFKTRQFGLPDRCNRWLGLRAYPYFWGARFFGEGRITDALNARLLDTIDNLACERIEPCDVLISMAGIGVRALDEVRQRYGARVFLERSSVHILTQRDILQRIPGAPASYSERFRYERELLGYGLSDVVTVPSHHVRQSFIDRGHAPERLFRNPFGVSLEQFQPTPAPAQQERPTILMTGAWMLRKGCDVLVEAWRKLPGTRLLHVGPVVDAPLPSDPLFEHVDAVPQSELPRFYAQGHVFALASREEGLATVQAQALACGVPVVCTTMTGGLDLKPWTVTPEAVRVVPPDDPAALASALAQSLATVAPPGELRDLLGKYRPELSWSASARRYEQRLLAALAPRPQATDDALYAMSAAGF
jgi:alpha-maltose-1-phosphate synthase